MSWWSTWHIAAPLAALLGAVMCCVGRRAPKPRLRAPYSRCIVRNWPEPH